MFKPTIACISLTASLTSALDLATSLTSELDLASELDLTSELDLAASLTQKRLMDYESKVAKDKTKCCYFYWDYDYAKINESLYGMEYCLDSGLKTEFSHPLNDFYDKGYSYASYYSYKCGANVHMELYGLGYTK